MENLSGRVIKGYELRELIGEGGFGAVYLAYQRLIGREVAVKIILPQHANQPDFIRRFESEAQLIARLEHPHIVPLYDYWREPSGAYLVMRWLRGGSLEQSLTNQGSWSLDRTTAMLNQIASALAVAHRQNIVHRDIKPANILLDENGNAYLSDFGIAKDLGGRQNITAKNAMVGSPAYISPEQIRGEPVTPQADIYMLGMMLYEVLTGRHPFAEATAAALLYKHLSEMPPDLHSINPNLPTGLNTIIQRAIAKEVTLRYDDVLELASDFRRTLRASSGGGDPHETVVIVSETLDLPEPDNPYKGLRAFQQADAADFFGREALVDKLLARMQESGSYERFLAVVGPSGSGKSSVVKAGLLPALQHGALPGSENWFMVEMVPGLDPMEELEAALLRIAVNPPDSLLNQLNEDDRGFVRAVKRVLPGDDSTELVLLIDQFEELFTLVEEETARQHLMNSVVEAISDPRGRVRVIVTLRADFYDRPLGYARFGELMQQRTEIVLPLSAEEIEHAVVGPAERNYLTLERGLVTSIVSDVQNQPGALPLLQYALTELFERREGRALTAKAYQDIGGTMGALARRADELYENLDTDGQEACRQLFLRLVTLGEGTEDTRRRVMQSELLSIGDAATMRDVIDAFGRYRLLTFDHDPGTRSSTVEVAHEALIRQWGKLREWLDESRDDLRLQRRVAGAAEEWLHSQKDPSFLAREARLVQIEEWAASGRVTLNQVERDYLEASVAERQRRQEAERARVEREELLEKRSQNRLRALVAVLAIATVIALALTGFALTQNQAAQEARTVAEQLADQAESARHEAEGLAAETQALALAANARTAMIEKNSMLALSLAMKASEAYQPAPVEVNRVLANAAYNPGVRFRLTGHTSAVTTTAFTPDAARGVSGSADGTLRLWDLVSGTEIWKVDTGRLITSADVSADGKFIVTGEAGLAVGTPDEEDDNPLGAVKLWDLETGELVRVFGENGGHTHSVMSVIFSPDGKRVLSGSQDRTVIEWDVETGEILQQLSDENLTNEQVGAVLALDISEDGRYVLSGHADETIANTADDFTDRILRVWDLKTGRIIGRFNPGAGFVRAVAISPDGTQVLTGIYTPQGGTLILWDVATGTELRRIIADSDVITTVDFSKDGQFAITGSWSYRVTLWHLSTGVELNRFDGFPDRVLDVAYSADGQYALVGVGNVGGNEVTRDTAEATLDSSVWLIDMRNRAQVRAFAEHQDWVWSADLTTDGSILATGTGPLSGTPKDTGIYLWDVASGQLIRRLEGHTATVDGLAFGPDGKTLLSGAWDQVLILWDTESGEEIRRFGEDGLAHEARIASVAYSSDGKLALSGAGDGQIGLWDVETGDLIRTLDGHTAEVTAFHFLPDDKVAISGSLDMTIKIWDIATGEVIRTITGHTDDVTDVMYSPDLKTLASTSWDGTVRLWDFATGEQIRLFTGHNGATFGVAFSPDGSSLVSGSRDQTVRLWDIASGDELRRFTGHTNWITALVFSPDGKWVFSTAEDNTARQWRVDRSTDDLFAFIEANRYHRELTCGEQRQYRLPLAAECESDS